MIEDYNDVNTCSTKIDIHPEFPLKKLVEAMRPYVTLYLLSKYSFILVDKITAKKWLAKKLKEFQRKNPLFSRKIITFVYSRKGIQ
jgi:hypothetical protein